MFCPLTSNSLMPYHTEASGWNYCRKSNRTFQVSGFLLTMLMIKTLGAMIESLFTSSVSPHSSLLCSAGVGASATGVQSDCRDNERNESAEAQRPFENLIVGDSARGRAVRCTVVLNHLRLLPQPCLGGSVMG